MSIRITGFSDIDILSNLKDEINERITYTTNKLEICSPDELLRYQGQLSAFRDILLLCDTIKNESEET
jgi:hypothetical protein